MKRDSFLSKFFPSVYCKNALDKSTPCAHHGHLFLVLVISHGNSHRDSEVWPEVVHVLCGVLLIYVGTAIYEAAVGVWMLTLGRILLGFGIGFSSYVLSMLLPQPPYL